MMKTLELSKQTVATAVFDFLEQRGKKPDRKRGLQLAVDSFGETKNFSVKLKNK